ncbi:hypothetical protein THAOC_36312 [Thalassiosira oceanica]|uniref:Uncharacterized protein n=1 Tax=Thalassiosira oceanica TaxID=159749 RepID=K0R8H9_THAOC|nr:hypothetical protein THAOC_36312 [Thalassiosira oceanica]|eukprot:EJK45091.1 hypothetical protein THAOC_36312 [Thalassiosira oceanica]
MSPPRDPALPAPASAPPVRVDVPVAGVAVRALGAVIIAVAAALPAALVRVGPLAELVAVAAATGPAAVVERLAVLLAAGAVEVRVLILRDVAVLDALLLGAAEADFLLHERCVKLHTSGGSKSIHGALPTVGPHGCGVDDGGSRGVDVNRVDRCRAADIALGRRGRERGKGNQEGEFHVAMGDRKS